MKNAKHERIGLMLFAFIMIAFSPGCLSNRSGEDAPYINTWLVAGPYKSASGYADTFEKDFIGEETVLPFDSKADWVALDDRLFSRNYDDYVDLYSYYRYIEELDESLVEQATAYAHIYVFSPTWQNAQLRVGTRDGFRAWVNGGTVGQVKETRPGFEGLDKFVRQARKDSDIIQINLEKGWNRVLLKVSNVSRIWGFYARISDSDGKEMEGLEYSLNPPDRPLAITTWEMPTGYEDWPYVWLTVKGDYVNNPSASRFRFCAEGGQAPYEWGIHEGYLPDGLSLDKTRGALDGSCKTQGQYEFTLSVTDHMGNTATRRLVINVVERPNRWVEQTRLGGLVHGHMLGLPSKNAELLRRIGYSWVAPVAEHHDGYAFWETKICNSQGERWIQGAVAQPGFDLYVDTMRKAGLKVGLYYSISEQAEWSFNRHDYYSNFPRYIEYMYGQVEELSTAYTPALYWFDGHQFPPGPDGTVRYEGQSEYSTYWEFDALYSMIRTIVPECLIVNNSGSATSGQDYNLGDVDIAESEGFGDTWYWVNWPNPQQGSNPKVMPTESWRWPNAGNDPGKIAIDWQEWARVIFGMISEGFICGLDGRVNAQVHPLLADWIEGRMISLDYTRPGPLDDEVWGYDVISDDGSTIYLHILENGLEARKKKIGWAYLERTDTLTVSPLNSIVVSVSRLYGKNDDISGSVELEFTQTGQDLTIDMSGVTPDPVVTTLIVKLKEPVE